MMGTCVAKSRNGKPIDTSRNYSRNPGKAHAQASNVSPPTQANKTTKQQPAEHAYTSRNRQPTGAARGDTGHAPPAQTHPAVGLSYLKSKT